MTRLLRFGNSPRGRTPKPGVKVVRSPRIGGVEHDGDTRLGEFAWYDASAGRRTHPVASRKPNRWGLHDVHGNVWEWCADWYAEDAYSTHRAPDPKGPAERRFRVIRGGCWYNRPVSLPGRPP